MVVRWRVDTSPSTRGSTSVPGAGKSPMGALLVLTIGFLLLPGRWGHLIVKLSFGEVWPRESNELFDALARFHPCRSPHSR